MNTEASPTSSILSSFTLLLLWFFNISGALLCFVLAEVYKKFTPDFPLTFIVILGCQLQIISPIVTFFIARQHHGPVFRFYQPFRGGPKFILLQFLGIFQVSFSVVASSVYLLIFDSSDCAAGVFLALGLVAFLGNVIVLVSGRYFETQHHHEQATFLRVLQRNPNSQIVVVVLLLFFQCVMAAVATRVPYLQKNVLRLMIAIELTIGCVIHVIVGYLYTAGYRLVMVSLSSVVDTIVLLASWGLYWTSLLYTAYTLKQSHSDNVDGEMCLSTQLSLVSSAVLLVLLRVLDFQKRSKAPSRNPQVSITAMAIATITFLICAFVTHASLYLHRLRTDAKTFKESPYIDIAMLLVSSVDRSFQSNLTIAVVGGHCLALISTPVCHMVGRMVFGATFSSLQGRKLSFVCFHMASSALFVLSVISLLLYCITSAFQWSLLTAGLSFISPVLLLSSFRLFSMDTLPSPLPEFGMVRQSSDTDYTSIYAEVLNGEFVTGFTLALVSFTIRLMQDVARSHVWGRVEMPTTQLLLIANSCFALSVPLVHISAREHGVMVFSPFSGSGFYVALQVAGWMTYGMHILIYVFSLLLGLFHSRDVTGGEAAEVVMRSIFLMDSWSQSLAGLLQFIPLFLIALSVGIESQLSLSRAAKRNKAVEGVKRLLHLTCAALSLKTPDEVRETQDLIDTLLRPALDYYQITDELNHAVSSAEELQSPAPFTSQYSSRLRHVHQSAFVIVAMLSMASSAFFVLAFFLSDFPLSASALELCAFLICTFSCVGVQAGYGNILHGGSEGYTAFTPFKGGVRFVYWQMAGWTCYSALFMISLICTTDPSTIGAPMMAVAVVLSVASQGSILTSIPLYSALKEAPNFVEENGEGLVALLSFLAVFGFQSCYHSLETFFGKTRGLSSIGYVLTVLSMAIAVPCIFISIGRTGSKIKSRQSSPTTGTRSTFAVGVTNALQIISLFIGAVVPTCSAYVVYSLSHSYTPAVSWVMEILAAATFVVVILVVILSLWSFVWRGGMLPVLSYIYVASVTWLTYNLALVVVSFIILLLVMIPRLSTILICVLVPSVTVLGGLPLARTGIVVLCYGSIGHVTLQLGSLVKNHVLDETGAIDITSAETWILGAGRPFIAYYLYDVLLLGLWIKYMGTFNHHPTTSGCCRSERFISWMKRLNFACCAEYFNFRIIADDESVKLTDPSHQFVFSFHPHGVFPGTALFAQFTDAWEQTIGSNAKTHVTTHVATVVLNTPLVRDFNLLVGSQSVSRKGLDASINRGNSVIIVTGGQAEMLHTCVSDHVMTLVTHHRGFIRFAIAKKVPLVPLLCFGEQNLLDLIRFPTIQKLTLPLLGFPFPLIPRGRFGLPFPFPAKLVLVVGRRVDIPEGADPDDEATVIALCELYFKELRELFYRHREAAGYPEMELRLVDKAARAGSGKKKEK